MNGDSSSSNSYENIIRNKKNMIILSCNIVIYSNMDVIKQLIIIYNDM